MKKTIFLLGMLLLSTFSSKAQECEAAAPPYNLDFESVTTPALPGCTSVTDITTGGQWTTAANPGNGFTTNVLQYTGTNTAADAWFFTKGIQLTAGTYYKLSYTYGNNSETTTESFKVVVASSPNAASVTTTINTVAALTGGASTNYPAGLISVPTTGVYYIGFNAYSAADQGNIYIDDIAVTEWTCMLPENLVVTNVTTTTATISFDAPGDNTSYNFFYWFSTSPEVPNGGPALAPGVTTVNIADLMPNTTYYAFASNQCGPLMGAWTTPVAFTTAACAAATTPYMQDFETATVPAIPECNQVAEIDGGNQWTTAANPGSGFTTNALVYPPSDEAANAWFFTQGVQITGGVYYKISYTFGNNSADTTEHLKVYITSSPNAPPTGSTAFANHTITGGTPETKNVDFFNVPQDGIYYLGFNADSDGERGSIYVDNISITENVCGTPANVTVTDITQTTATVNWEVPSTGNAPISVYQYAVGTTNTPPTTGIIYNPAFTTPLTDLAPDTIYYVFTRTQCGPVFSEWTTTQFTTATAGLNDVAFNGLTVYPNPVKNILKIDNTAAIEKVALYNITGQVVYTQAISGATNAEINLEQLSSGIYTLNIQANGSSKKVKVIKQ